MIKYLFPACITGALILSCSRANTDTPPPAVFIEVTLRADLSSTACSGGYVFLRQGSPPIRTSHYQSDSLPVPAGTAIKPKARIRFHPVFTHCTIADTLIVVDEIIFLP